MYSAAIYLGGLVRWLFKGCRTNFKDEVAGRFDPTWGGSYDFENYIIGLVTVIVVLGVLALVIL